MRVRLGTALFLAFTTLTLLSASPHETGPVQPIKEGGTKAKLAEAKVALRLEAADDRDGARVRVFLENLTDQPIKLRDHASPAFSPWPNVKARVDGKDADLQARAAFAVFFDKADERTIDAKKRFELGAVLVTAKGSRPAKDEPLVPVLFVEPGTRTIELSLKRDDITLGIPGRVAPARVKVKVAAAKGDGGTDPKR